ncbi:MAG: serine/threonine-protein kinase [Oscillochloridaceae bacterium]|nr:serine/threonine protein kinase [Chloroflexaceae bacterium]MDW8389944.1 serine/threonine-protein kinase [Oscillochloridaceae bacterium]
MAPNIRLAGEAAARTGAPRSAMAEVTQILCPFCLKANLPHARFCQHCGRDVVLNNDGASNDPRRYRITRVIKKGGQGAVYEGVDQHGHVYAIKMMLDRMDDPREQAEAVARFNAEAEVLQNLNHPAVPRVYSHFTDEGRHYLTMDFVRGEDLEQIIEREQRIPEARALAWADQICDVLEHLHARGVIYRDMKPSNVMIDHDGGVKVVDFGIAKLFNPAERGTQIGTPGYAPPEQYQGLATPQSDVYALGATLHHLLTGRDPTEEKPFSFPPARDLVPSISQRTNDALVRALQFKADDRFATIAEFRAALNPQGEALPPQVRVARPTVLLSASAADRTAPPPVVTSQPAPPAVKPPPAPAAAIPPPPSPIAPAARPQRNPFARLATTFLALALAGAAALGAYVYTQRPAWAEPYVAPLLSPFPTTQPDTTPTGVPAIPRLATFDLEVTVPESAGPADVRAELISAFEERARVAFGPNARLNPNAPPTPIGEPQVVARKNGQVTYQARMQGYVYMP